MKLFNGIWWSVMLLCGLSGMFIALSQRTDQENVRLAFGLTGFVLAYFAGEVSKYPIKD